MNFGKNSEKMWKLVIHSVLSSKAQKQPPEVFLRKGILKICSKFTGEHPYQSAILIKLLWNFIENADSESQSK